MPSYNAALAVTKDLEKAEARRHQLKVELVELDRYLEVLQVAHAALNTNGNGSSEDPQAA